MARKQQPSEQALLDAGEAVRAACLRAAQDGYELAAFSGLCAEGRWEMVFDSIRSLDVAAIVRELARDSREEGADDA